MRMNFQTSYLLRDTDTQQLCAPSASPSPKAFVAKPRKNPNIAQIRKKVVAKYSRTIAYLAK